ncbi:MAG: 2,3-bisphosphoglycerate-independent phosphoglycerate mutase [Neomegalonema sp.]|nr:2,3-bisphosphoglycerate-independent phosphoglycerate mutase [Neomegalonema sp.]
MTDPRTPVVLCIMDGWGLRAETEANAVALAHTPFFDKMRAECPSVSLRTSGQDVGLPDGQMGNSEVGHMNLGAGRVVWMDLPKIDNTIADGSFGQRQAITDFIQKMKASGGTAHLMGLLSPGGVHSHQRHIAAAARVLSEAGVPVALHLFLDGRDTPPQSAGGYLADFERDIDGLTKVRIASVSGRFFAMDRDNRWERVEKAYDVIVGASGEWANSADDAIELAYGRGETDEFAAPTAIGEYNGVKPGDGIFMANFRSDRAREILLALLDPQFEGFARSTQPDTFAAALGMVEYSTRHNTLMDTVFAQEEIKNTLGLWVSEHGKTQFRLAETEKYPHVTFFFNGGVEEPNTGEERYMAPSPKVKTYDLAPEMSSGEVTEQLVKAIASRAYDLIIVNYANPDMVGHTGDLAAAIKAVESVDRGVGAAWKALENAGGSMLVTADHGNCEMMIDPATGGPHTAHTTNVVPISLIDFQDHGGEKWGLRDGGRLGDVAPTLLALMGLPQPEEMTGESLLSKVG